MVEIKHHAVIGSSAVIELPYRKPRKRHESRLIGTKKGVPLYSDLC